MKSVLLLLFAMFAGELSPFDPLLGEWTGTGNLRGAPVNVTYSWKKMLADKFVSLDYGTTDPKTGREAFSGHAMYKPAEGTWHDSNGAIYPISWKMEDGAIISEWGIAGTIQGKSVYRVKAADEVEVVDYVKGRSGAWSEFAHYTAHRKRALQ